MKKFILCLFAVAMLTSCAPSPYKEAETTDAEHVKVTTENTCTLLDIYRVNYNGHSYILFDGDSNLNGIVHDPDCSCHKSNETDFGF